MASVLIVDDDPDIRALLVTIIAAAGHDVAEAPDGACGLDLARSIVPDVILLDWMMPGLTGVEVCAALRSDTRFDATTIMLVTARAQPSDAREGASAGADAVIGKPFSARELRARVEAATNTGRLAS